MALHDSHFIPQDPALFAGDSELEKLKSYVLRQHGWPLIRCEITEEQLTDAILDSIQRYHEYAAIEYDMRIIDVLDGNTVELPEDMRGAFVSDVIFPKDYYDSVTAAFAGSDVLSAMGGVMSLDDMGNTIGDFEIAQYYMHMQQLEDFKKIAGLQKTWAIYGGIVHLFPASRSYSKIGILYKPMLSTKEAEQIWWIKDYAVAKAGLIIGRIRSKLSGFSSTGANLSSNGEALMSDSKADMTDLWEKLMTMGVPMPILQG